MWVSILRCTPWKCIIFSNFDAVRNAISCEATIRVSRSHALRTRYGTECGLAWCPLIRPHNFPSQTMEIEIDESVPMLRIYSRGLGEEVRRRLNDRSRPSTVLCAVARKGDGR